MAETRLDIAGGIYDARARRAAAKGQAANRARERLILNEATRDRTAGEILSDTGVGLLQGAVTLGESAYGIGNLATAGLLERGLGLSENFDRTQQILEGAKSTQLKYDKLVADQRFENEGIIAGVSEYLTNPALLGDLAATQVASVIPTAAVATRFAANAGAGALARGATREAAAKTAGQKAGAAAVAVGGAQMGGNAYVQAYNQAIEEGLTPEEANERALASGYATGVVGAAISKLPGIGAAGIEGRVAAEAAGVRGAVGTFGRTLVSATGRETAEETLQSGTEQFIQNVASVDPNRDLMDGVAKNAAMGAVGGGLLGMGMGVTPAAARLRSDINTVMKDVGEDAGVPEAAASSLEQEGTDQLQQEAAAERETNATLQAATERLVGLGFVAEEDGTFSHPDLGTGFTADEALAVAADESIELTPPPPPGTQQAMAFGFEPQDDGTFSHPTYGENFTLDEALDLASEEDIQPLAPLPEVTDLDEQGEQPPLPDVEESATGRTAFNKAMDSLRRLGATRTVIDGRPVMQVTDTTEDGTVSTVDLDDMSAIQLAIIEGGINEAEAAEAARYMRQRNAPYSRSNTAPVTEFVTADDVAAAARQEEEALALASSDAVPDSEDPDSFWIMDEDELSAKKITRTEALQRAGYVAEGNDLLGPETYQQAVQDAEEQGNPEPELQNEAQLELQGLDPLFSVVDPMRRRAAGAAVLESIAYPGTGAPLPAPENMSELEQARQMREGWNSLVDGAVEMYNQTAENPVNYTASMRNSKLIRGFIDGALKQGITPTSMEAFDYIQEQARAAEADPAKAAAVLGALAEVANAHAPGTADISRWRKALARKGIAKPGNMRGPAYQKFKKAVERATITPGSSEFDTFMSNFSAKLSKKDAETTFGQNIREAYPYTPPVRAAAKAEVAKDRQVLGTKKPAKPVIGEAVAPLMKSGEEAVLTDPVPETSKAQPKTEKGKRVNSAKKKVRKTMGDNYRGMRKVEQDLREKTNAVRNPRPEDLVGDDETGAVDPDVVAAEREAAQPQQPAGLSIEAAQEAEQIVVEAERRVRGMANKLAEDILDLKAAYSDGNLAGEEDANAWQDAWGQELGERMAKLDVALAKDAPDLASWSALMQVVMGSKQFSKYADANTKYKQFIQPMMQRYVDLLGNVTTADGVRVYRSILDSVNLPDFITQELGGQQLANAARDHGAVQQLMDQMIDRMTADPANARNVHPFKVNKAKYSQLPSQRTRDAMPRAELDAIVSEYNRNRPEVSTPFAVVGTVAEAQQMFGIAVPSAANGLYYNGQAIVIAENIADADMAREVILHERTHGGLEALLTNERLPAVMNRLWANPQVRRRIQTKMRRQKLNRIAAAEEVLVDMIVSGETLNKSLFSKIRAAIANRANELFGMTDLVMSDAAVNELLRDTGDYLRGAKHELDLQESYVTGLEAYMSIFDGKSVLRSPMFSVASSDLEAYAAGGGESAISKFQNSHVDARNDALVRNLSAKAKGQAHGIKQRVSRLAMDFMPLSQIAENHRGLFYENGTDLLKQFTDDKQSKENEFNKVIQKERELTYRGADGKETKFKDSMMGIAREWQDVANKRGNQADALNVVNQQGTFYKVHPDRTWEQQAELNYDKENFSKADRRQAYEQVTAEWNKLNDDNKQLYRKVQAAYGALWGERMAQLEAQAERIASASTELPDPDNPTTMIGTGEWKAKIDRKRQVAINRIKEGPYSPLSRFGDYYVVVRDKKTGSVVFSSGHDTQAEAEGMEASIRDRGLDTDQYTVTATLRQQFVRELDGMSLQQYQQIQNALQGMFPTDNESDRYARGHALAAMEELYLQSQPDGSLLKHANARKGIGGATLDSFRAFNDYTIKSARNISSMKYDHKIQGALSKMAKYPRTGDVTAMNMKRAEVFNAVQRQHIESQQAVASPWSQFLTTTGFVMYMTSPSQMALNMSQTALVTMPVLAARYGVGDTMKYIAEASKEWARSNAQGMHSERGKLNPDSVMAKVMTSLNDDGTLDFTQTHDLSDMAQRDSDLMHSRLRKVMEGASTFMRLSEIYNRETAAYVVVRGEMRMAGMTDEQFNALPEQRQAELLERWTTKARDAVKQTQFIYSQSNKPRVMQGNLGRVVFQFRQFQVNMLALMYRTARDSILGVRDPSLTLAEQRAETKAVRKQLAYMLTTQLTLTGAASSIFAPVAFALADLFGDDDDILSAEEKFLQWAPTAVSHGLIGGFLDPQRFGFNTLVPILGGARYMPTSDNPQDKLDHILLNSLGPAYGIGSQWLRGANQLVSGEIQKGMVDIVPKPLADMWKANVLYVEGIEDRQGIVWYEPTVYDRVMNTLGLKTGEQAEVQADRSAIYSGKQRATDRRSSLVGDFVIAPDAESRADAMRSIADWNRRWGSDSALVIKQSTLKRAQQTRREKERNALQTGVPSTRIPDAVLRQINND